MGGDRRQVLGEKANRILREMLSNRKKMFSGNWKTSPEFKERTVFYDVKNCLFFFSCHL